MTSYSVGASSKQHLGKFFEASAQPPRFDGSPQMHACVVCGDDASTKKMKKLGCGHRWCRPCVQRQSKSSGAYAQDMPPRCCTLELVPLAHANEASHTAKYPAGDHNYCPRAQCKTRIRPEDVHHYSNGRSDATCRKCGTRICGSCYGKWHEAKRCPTEAGTTQLKLARQPGWKRCFNCQANVQLEEGCNRMSCRCGAQLCLICGSKGRTCACSPFTYDLDEEEEFDHVQIPVPMVSRERLGGTGGLPRGLRPGPAYTHEPQHYRGPRDDHLARRLQHGDVYNHEEEDEDEDEDEEDDYLNAMGHVPSPFANGDFRRSRNTVVPPAPPSVPLAPASVTHERPQAGGNYVSGVNKARGVRASSMERRLADRFSDQRQASTPRHHPFGQPMPSPTAPPMGMGPLPLPHQIPMVPSPISRRHTMDDDMYEVPFDPRYAPPSFPRRATAHAYMDDFALDTPMGRRRTRHMEPPKEAELAGLTGPNSGVNRVSEWRTYVDPFPLGSQTVV
ncbi:hypothetical protein F4808DRAFT_174985 [Astrocystis sublimbata]|nr:hypothetical protein F4808DRAFT_174985 [Astrocystis sublimbata]